MINPNRSTLTRMVFVSTLKMCCVLVMIGTGALCWDSLVAVKAKSPSSALSLYATGSITANPNPIPVCDGTGLGITTLSWTSTGTSVVEVHLDEPSGMLLATSGPSGTVTTGKWVGHATQFFLQDASGGLPLSPENTLATVTVYLTGCSSPGDGWTNNSNNINNTNTGNVGIGTSGPVFKLDVRGGQINSAEGFCIAGDCKSAWSEMGGAGSSQWNNADSNIFFTTGNVGVGTGSPGARLDIGGGNLRVQSGTLDLNNQVRDDSINLWGGFYTLGIRHLTFYAKTYQRFRFESGLGEPNLNAYELGSTAGATFFAVKNDGNVGIGTTGPTSLFTTSQAPLNDATNRVGNYLFMESRNNTGSNIASTHTVLSVEGSTNNGYTWNGQTGVKSTVGPNWGGITDAFAFYANGRTQLNWHSISNLHNFYAASPTVVANSFISNSFGLYLAAQKAPNVVNGYGVYQAGAVDLNYFAGNVGIGIPPTNFKLDVNGEINATGLRINGTPISTGPSGAVNSVFGRTGAVAQQAGDYTWAQITKTSSSLGDLTTRSAGDLNAGTVPIARLGVSGTANTTTFLRGDNTWAVPSGGSSPWATDGTNVFVNPGKVGIGTATPQRPLHIVHQSQSEGNQAIYIDEYGAAPDIRFRRAQGTIANPSGVISNNAIGAITAAGYGGANGFSAFRGLISINASENWTDSAQGTFIAFYNTAAGGVITSEKMRLASSGSLGINTTNPNPIYKLDVNGEINATGLRINNVAISTGGPGGPVTWAQVDKSVSSLADIATRNAGDLNAGTVPIGRIGLSGNAGVSTFLRGDNTWAPVPGGPSQWTTADSNIYYNSGNVGIGTTAGASVVGERLTVNTFAGFGDRALTTPFVIVGNTGAPTGIVGTLSNHNLSFRANNADHMILTSSGNLGIGTTSPGAKLEVNGNTNVTGNINVTGTGNITAAGTIEGGNIKAKYQDVAEWVGSSQELPTGTVVVIDHTKSNQVIASSQAYDTRVAGVISERPGITLGESGDKKVLVATTGRVLLVVDASTGPIQIGDLLVTSDIPGVAMKSEAINVGSVHIHRPGTLVGKALEPLAKGQGKVLVLLSLQ